MPLRDTKQSGRDLHHSNILIESLWDPCQISPNAVYWGKRPRVRPTLTFIADATDNVGQTGEGTEMPQQYDSFADMFTAATGHTPYPYQDRIGSGSSMPSVIDIPPGYGKTAAAVLTWVWLRHFHSDPAVRENTPIRLIMASPMRTLTEQTLSAVRIWLERLGFAPDEIALELLIGGMARGSHSWRARPDRPQIIVGTVDMIISRMLVRGYGSSRSVYPIDAAIMWNDSHVVLDEIQLAPSATVTARQISAFQSQFRALRCGLTCMSATVDLALLGTVDNPTPAESDIVTLSDDDMTDALGKRRSAARTICELSTGVDKPSELAAAVVRLHRTGLTLVIVNTVAAAIAVYQQLERLKMPTPVTLLHSRFRPIDRAPLIEELLSDSADRIVVSTQVVEAGLDIDARTLITEAPAWPSLIQRSGRCNRAGSTDDAQLWWFPPAKPGPYEQDDLDASVEQLRQLEAVRLTNEDLIACAVPHRKPEVQVLRRDDFLSLFDTTPDLTGSDLDIAPYIRDSDDLDAQLAWIDLDGAKPAADLRLPEHEYRCRVPLGSIAALVKDGVRVWYFEQTEHRWRTLHQNRRARPGEVLLLDCANGRYRTRTGFDAKSKMPVDTHAPSEFDLSERTADREVQPSADSSEADPNSVGSARWIPLDQHLLETEAEARHLTLTLDLNPAVVADIALAAKLHDTGKAHLTWQNALRTTHVGGDGPIAWAKSPGTGRLRYHCGITTFRHEVASVALLDGPFESLLLPAQDRDLVRYLVAAHHGKARVQFRNPTNAPAGSVLGLIEGAESETLAVLGLPASRTVLNLDPLRSFSADGGACWEDVITGLLDRYGVFQLAYFEMLVRVADWRASARHEQEAQT